MTSLSPAASLALRKHCRHPAPLTSASGIPYSSVRVEVTAPPQQRDEQILSAVRELRPSILIGGNDREGAAAVNKADDLAAVEATSEEMAEREENSPEIRQLEGGLSNHLYVVSIPSRKRSRGQPSSVLVRVHCEDEDDGENDDAPEGGNNESGAPQSPSFVDREVETRLLVHLSKLSNANNENNGGVFRAPQLYGRFANGRIEEFYISARPLSCKEMSIESFGRGIARELAKFHSVFVPEGLFGFDESERKMGMVWRRIERWIDVAEENVRISVAAGNHRGGEPWDFDWMRSELRWLRSELITSESQGMESDSSGEGGLLAKAFFGEVVLSHNDCQSLNILTTGPKNDGNAATSAATDSATSAAEENVRLIDFEYASLDARATDIANTFCELCDMNNLRPDYEEEYPSKEAQVIFLEEYVRTASPTLALRLDGGDGAAGGWRRCGTRGESWETFLESSREMIGRHSLLSHLQWAAWAISQSGGDSSIDFDYGKYGRVRLEGYRAFKGWFFPSLTGNI